jgi:hypothetical protein
MTEELKTFNYLLYPVIPMSDSFEREWAPPAPMNEGDCLVMLW